MRLHPYLLALLLEFLCWNLSIFCNIVSLCLLLSLRSWAGRIDTLRCLLCLLVILLNIMAVHFFASHARNIPPYFCTFLIYCSLEIWRIRNALVVQSHYRKAIACRRLQILLERRRNAVTQKRLAVIVGQNLLIRLSDSLSFLLLISGARSTL